MGAGHVGLGACPKGGCPNKSGMTGAGKAVTAPKLNRPINPGDDPGHLARVERA